MRRASPLPTLILLRYIDACPGLSSRLVSMTTNAWLPFSLKVRTVRAVNRATPSGYRGFPFEVLATAAASSSSTSFCVTWQSLLTENPLFLRSSIEIAVGWTTPSTMWSGFQRDLVNHSRCSTGPGEMVGAAVVCSSRCRILQGNVFHPLMSCFRSSGQSWLTGISSPSDSCPPEFRP